MSDKEQGMETGRIKSEEERFAEVRQTQAMNVNMLSEKVGIQGMTVGRDDRMFDGNATNRNNGVTMDTAREKAAEESVDRTTLQGFEEGLIAEQGMSAQNRNYTIENSVDLAKDAQAFAIQQDTQGREAGRETQAAAAPQKESATNLDDHTRDAVNNGILSNISGKGGDMQKAMSQVKEAGIGGALRDAGVSSRGSIFGGAPAQAPAGPNLLEKGGQGMGGPR